MIDRRNIYFTVLTICAVLSFDLTTAKQYKSNGSRFGRNGSYSGPAYRNFPSPPMVKTLRERDPSSFATPEKEITEHIDLKWNVDFKRQVIAGTVTYSFKILAKSIDSIFLDVKDLNIKKIVLLKDNTERQLNYFISDRLLDIGSKLTIELSPPASGKLKLAIEYETSPKSVGLQWLTPEQTLGKMKPFMFSRCQPVAGRSVFPCQDTPAVKFTYSATVTHPEDLTLLLGAIRLNSTAGRTVYEQKVKIPSSLFAIAAGDLHSRKIGPRSRVWAEKGVLAAAAEEFSETASMLKVAEDICGPYAWKQYDILLMPPSFPVGGVENPCLTFVSPTLIAGDKSLTGVIAHEIAHCWSGNLVSIVNFQHYWLSEGFTTFIEGKIGGRLEGDLARDFQSIRNLQVLKHTIKTDLADKPQLAKLVIDLTNTAPGDGFSFVLYGKGQIFLCYLEDLLGGPESFDKFLRFYFNKFKYQSISTDDFKASIYEFFGGNYKNELATVDWDLWLYGEGMPPIIPKFNTTMADIAHKHAKIWIKSSLNSIKAKVNNEKLNSLQKIEFLAKLNDAQNIASLSPEWISLLEEIYELNKTQNSEIRSAFSHLCIKAKDFGRLDEILAFANSNFRIKFLVPLYRELGKWPKARDIAISNYKNVKNRMMELCSIKIARALKLA